MHDGPYRGAGALVPIAPRNSVVAHSPRARTRTLVVGGDSTVVQLRNLLERRPRSLSILQGLAAFFGTWALALPLAYWLCEVMPALEAVWIVTGALLPFLSVSVAAFESSRRTAWLDPDEELDIGPGAVTWRRLGAAPQRWDPSEVVDVAMRGDRRCLLLQLRDGRAHELAVCTLESEDGPAYVDPAELEWTAIQLRAALERARRG